jgi:hypothetical protein
MLALTICFWLGGRHKCARGDAEEAE